MESLFEKLRTYGESEYYPYHMPGHKRNTFGELPEELIQMDITEIDGFDNLHQPEDLFLELQQAASRLYGAEESFYLVNGSTAGVLSAVSAALPKGGHILMARNAHRSAYHAAYLRGLVISYLYPLIMESFDVCDAVAPDQVREALEKEPDIGAIFLVSPTYEGRIARVRDIVQVAHEKGIPVIVDEAHGAHLGLAEGFCENSCQAGADLVIHSVHKTLPAMTQTALLHVNGDRIQRSRLRRFLHIYQSSSPSYILMASIDNALRVAEREGAELFRSMRERYCWMLQCLESGCRCLEFLPMEEGQDIGKLVISGVRYGVSGRQIYDILRCDYHLQLEMASASYCLAMFTMGDRPEGYERMTRALLALDERIAAGEVPGLSEKTQNGFVHWITSLMKNRGTPLVPFAKAWDMQTQWRDAKDAIGCPAGEFINLYPPGIPLLVPGEVFTDEHYRQIVECMRQGLHIQGIRPVSEKSSEYYINILTGVGDTSQKRGKV